MSKADRNELKVLMPQIVEVYKLRLGCVMNRIVQGAHDALAIAKGELDPKEYAVNVPQNIDVRRIRKKLGMTQAAFARVFGFSLATLRHWEQQKRIPEGPARAYLTVIDRDPDAVRKALCARDDLN